MTGEALGFSLCNMPPDIEAMIDAMTSFISTIPMGVLLPLGALVVVMAVYSVEMVAYFRFAGWYYRSGPTVLRERWQTTAPDAQIRQAIRPLLGADQLVGRESAEGFCFRQRGGSINAWTRIELRIEETKRGVALHYQVRPFYTFAPMILPIGWLAAGAFGMGGLTLLTVVAPFAIVFGTYRWIVPWDIARMGRLPTIRRALAAHGLLVCELCGYDLFGHTDADRCPECGSNSPAP